MKKFVFGMILFAVAAILAGVWYSNENLVVPEKISFMADTCLSENEGLNLFCSEYQKLTGIELDLFRPVHNTYREKMLRDFAVGKYPDVFEIMPDYLVDYMKFAKENKIAPLDKYIKRSAVFKNIDSNYVEALRFNGNIYGVPINSGGGCLPYVRKDWLDNLGLKEPKNWQEFYAVLKAFTDDDPNQNGVKDTFGITIPGLRDSMYLQVFYQGAEHDFVRRNGVWVDGFVEPAMEKALERLQLAYSSGAINKDFLNDKTSSCRDQFTNGQCGIFPYWAGHWAENLQIRTVKVDPKADVIALPAFDNVSYVNRIGPIIAISKAGTDGKTLKPKSVFKHIIEFMHDGSKGEMLFVNGVEGVHWKQEGDDYTKLPSLANPQNLFSKAYTEPALILNEKFENPFSLSEKEQASIDAFHSSRIFRTLPPDSATYDLFSEQILDLKISIMSDIILGLKTYEEGMQLYRDRSRTLHVQQILDEANNVK